jgi:hypothetical protein
VVGLALTILMAFFAASCDVPDESDLPCVHVQPKPISVARAQAALREHGIATVQGGCFVDDRGPVDLVGTRLSISCLVYPRPARGPGFQALRDRDGEPHLVQDNVECFIHDASTARAVRRALQSMARADSSGDAVPGADGRADMTVPRGTIGVVSSRDFRTVFLISPRTGAIARVRAPDKVVDLRADLARDGNRIAIGGLRGVWTFRRSGGGARFLGLRTRWSAAGWTTWSPSGRELVFEREEALYTVAATGRRPTRLFAGPAYAPDWSPTGTFIVFVRNPAPSTGAGLIQAIGTSGGSLRSIVRGGHPDVSPDGLRIAFARREGVYVMPVAGGRPRLVVRDAEHPEWSPDGRYLAFTRAVQCGEGGCSGRVFVVRATGGRARAFGPAIFEVGPLAWSR